MYLLIVYIDVTRVPLSERKGVEIIPTAPTPSQAAVELLKPALIDVGDAKGGGR